MNIPNIQDNIPLAPYTTFKIGGPAKYFVVAKSAEEIVHAVKEAQQAGVQWFLLGGGSDVLVSDKGFDGLVIKNESRGVEFIDEKQQVRADSGVRLSSLITQCLQKEYQGLEYAIGVPATVGGSIWANLGARGHEIQDFIIEVRVIDHTGEIRTLTKEECQFSYRESIFKHEKFVILDALFQLQKGEKTMITEMMQGLAQLRKETQDVGSKCAGCVFRNPKEQTDEAAAKLIDDLGLKGKQIGGAKVSDVHSNFIINTGNATAEDVVILISYIKQQVRDKKGVQLMEEIEYIGF
jgi:UDP-N-acetylmuramate dehydrogenase